MYAYHMYIYIVYILYSIYTMFHFLYINTHCQNKKLFPHRLMGWDKILMHISIYPSIHLECNLQYFPFQIQDLECGVQFLPEKNIIS